MIATNNHRDGYQGRAVPRLFLPARMSNPSLALDRRGVEFNLMYHPCLPFSEPDAAKCSTHPDILLVTHSSCSCCSTDIVCEVRRTAYMGPKSAQPGGSSHCLPPEMPPNLTIRPSVLSHHCGGHVFREEIYYLLDGDRASEFSPVTLRSQCPVRLDIGPDL